MIRKVTRIEFETEDKVAATLAEEAISLLESGIAPADAYRETIWNLVTCHEITRGISSGDTMEFMAGVKTAMDILADEMCLDRRDFDELFIKNAEMTVKSDLVEEGVVEQEEPIQQDR